MTDINAIVNYFEKLQKIIIHYSDLSFGNKKFIKKNKIDDILCCIIAKLPDEYKKTNIDRYKSVKIFKNLYSQLRQPFFLMPNHYMINYDNVNLLLMQIKNTLVQDINTIERINTTD